MKKISENKYLIFIFIAVLLIFAVWYNNKYYVGHDTKPHSSNIYALSSTITIDKPLGSRIYPFVANDFGYGTGIFYPLLADYIPALIFKLTSNFSTNIFYSVKTYYFIITLISAVIMYILSNKIFKNKHYATLSSIMYIFMPYFLSNIFVRDALGETLIFLVVPLSFLGIYELFDKNYKKFLLLFVGAYFIGMNSHLVLMIYLTFFLIIFLLFNYKKVLQPSTMKYLIIASIFILSLSSPYLGRLIQNKTLGNYVVFSKNSMASLESVLAESLKLTAYVKQEVHHDNIWLCINFVTLILIIFTLLVKKKIIFNESEKTIFNYTICITIILIFMMSPLMFWHKLPSFLLTIQFPWRLEIILFFILSLVSPIGLNIVKDCNYNKYIAICLILLTIFLGLNYVHFNSNELANYKEFDWNAAMGWQKEYLPINSANNLGFLNNRNNLIHLLHGDAEIEILNNDISCLEFSIKNLKTESVTIQLPRIYYLGYRLSSTDGQKHNYYEDDKGFVSVMVNQETTFKFKYYGTKIDIFLKHYAEVQFIVFVVYLIKSDLLVRKTKNDRVSIDN